jgi:hypothetical protein
MAMRVLLQRLAEALAGLHLTVAVEGERRVVSLLWQGVVGGYELAIVQPPGAAPVLVLRAGQRGQWGLCLPAEVARKGLVLTAEQATAAAAGAAWRAAVAAERRAAGVRPWRPR